MSKTCEVCGDIANTLCLECNKYLCDECDALVHKRERNKSHKREVIDKNLPVDTKCPEHTKYPLEYLCENDCGTTMTFC